MFYKKKIEELDYEIAKLESEISTLKANCEDVFADYVINENNLICPVCGGKVHLVIDAKYNVFDSYYPIVENYGTTAYKIKCNNRCVGVRDESIVGVIERFKSLKIGGDKDGTGKD